MSIDTLMASADASMQNIYPSSSEKDRSGIFDVHRKNLQRLIENGQRLFGKLKKGDETLDIIVRLPYILSPRLQYQVLQSIEANVRDGRANELPGIFSLIGSYVPLIYRHPLLFDISVVENIYVLDLKALQSLVPQLDFLRNLTREDIAFGRVDESALYNLSRRNSALSPILLTLREALKIEHPLIAVVNNELPKSDDFHYSGRAVHVSRQLYRKVMSLDPMQYFTHKGNIVRNVVTYSLADPKSSLIGILLKSSQELESDYYAYDIASAWSVLQVRGKLTDVRRKVRRKLVSELRKSIFLMPRKI